MYFSRKQYFRDTTAPAGLSETLPIRNVPAVSGRFVNIRNPETLDRRNDYFGNELLTIKDRNGVIRQVSLMKGANKPRGINANVKWSMAPNKFKRGRGLRTDTNLFYEPPKRRDMTTEFFKSRYQSAYEEMLIEKRIRDSEKVGANQLRILNDQNKKLQDRLDATLQSNKLAEDRLAQDKLHHQQLLLAISNTTTPSMITMGTPEGNAAAALVGGGDGKGGKGKGGKGKDAPPPPPQLPPPPAKSPEQIEAETKKAREAAQAGLGAGGDIVSQLKAIGGLSPADILKAAKEEKKKRKEEAAGASPPAAEEGGGTLGDALAAALGENKPKKSKLQLLEDIGGGDSPVGLPEGAVFAGIPTGGLAPAVSEGAESAISVRDTPRTRERKLKFFGRRGLAGGLEEVDIAKLDEEGVEAVGASTAFSPEEKREILRGLSGKMSDKVRKEAEKQLKLISEQLGETTEANIGGEKQTSTPRPPLTEELKVDNPLDSETTDEEDEPAAEAISIDRDFLSSTGLTMKDLEDKGMKQILNSIKKSSNTAEEYRKNLNIYNQYLNRKSGTGQDAYDPEEIDRMVEKKFPPKKDFYTPPFPHEEIGEIKSSKEFKEAHDNSKFENPVQIKFGNPRVGGALGISGGFGYIADFDDVKKTFDPLPKPKEKGIYGINAWKKAKAKLDNWDMFKDQPFKEINVPKENPDGTLQKPVFTKQKGGFKIDKQRVNEIFLPADEEYAKAFGVDWDRHEELRLETEKRGGQREAIRKFKKGDLVSFGGSQVKVVSQKGDNIVVESEDGNITINMDDLD